MLVLLFTQVHRLCFLNGHRLLVQTAFRSSRISGTTHVPHLSSLQGPTVRKLGETTCLRRSLRASTATSREGTYSYQELLPSEGELTAEYGCSRNTLRRAVSMLADDAYVQPMHGRGVRVIWQREAHSAQGSLEGVESFGEYARRNGLVPGTHVKSFERVTCGAGLARRTGFAEGVELVRVVRVRTLDDVARQVDHDYFLASAVPGLTAEQAEKSVYSYLENDLGMRILTSRRRITVRRLQAFAFSPPTREAT